MPNAGDNCTFRMHPTGSPRLLDKLVEAGLIKAEQREAAINVSHSLGVRIEEALIDANAVDETRLLKFIASYNHTRFVSTEKLSKAGIDQATLEKVPQKFAEQWTVFPVLFDARTSTLSVVTPDPDDEGMKQELQLVSGARAIQTFAGRPRAVKAAISRAYGGDIHAFAALDRSVHLQFSTMLDVYERNLVSEETMKHSLATESVSRERVLGTEDLASERIGCDFIASRGVNTKSYLETLNVLVTLSENSRSDLRGHSAHVARLIQKMAERIGVPELERDAFMIGAYVHDLGKAGSFHLTALNVAEYEGHRLTAQKQLSAPTRLLEAVRLPPVVESGVQAMYERFDGKGIPQGSRGKDIPLLARALAIVDTYADITQNPRNPYRHALTAVKACEVLKRFASAIFDPNLVDLFKILVTGDDLKAQLLADRHRILLVDTDPEETTVLELRMIEQGFEVRLARTAEQAFKCLASGEISLVISELDLEQGDGLSLLAEVRKQPWGTTLPWIIATKRSARGDAQRAFELSVADYVTKPVSLELFTAKVKQILERQAVSAGPRGVSGALSEMGLPEIVQILHHGRKTGRLKVRSGAESGEIHFVTGEVFNALYANLRGEEAFYAMLRLTDGEFALDPAFEARQRVIRENPESLLLEGMRRLDESTR